MLRLLIGACGARSAIRYERSAGQSSVFATTMVPAGDDDRDDPEPGEQLEDDARERARADDPDQLVEVRARLLDRDLTLGALAAEDADHADAAEHLEEEVEEHVRRLAQVERLRERTAREDHDREHRERHGDERPDRERRADRDRRAEEPERERAVEDHRREPVDREPHLRHVGADRLEEVAVALAVEVRDGEREEVADEPVDEAELDHLGDPLLRDAKVEVEEGGADVSREEEAGDDLERGHRAEARLEGGAEAPGAADRAGEELVREEDDQERERRAPDRAEDEAREEPLLPAEERREVGEELEAHARPPPGPLGSGAAGSASAPIVTRCSRTTLRPARTWPFTTIAKPWTKTRPGPKRAPLRITTWKRTALSL